MFFGNRRPGYFEKYGLTAEELSHNKPGLIHATVVLHGERGPWANRVGFDEVGAAVSGLFFERRHAGATQNAANYPDLRQRRGLARNRRRT